MEIDKNTSLMKVIDLEKNAVAFEEAEPVLFDKGKVTVTLKENPNEYLWRWCAERTFFTQRKSN